MTKLAFLAVVVLFWAIVLVAPVVGVLRGGSTVGQPTSGQGLPVGCAGAENCEIAP